MHKVIILGITLVALLSGCGESQSTADRACEAYRSGNRDALISKFAALYRENPAYDKELEAANNYIQAQIKIAELESKESQGEEAIMGLGISALIYVQQEELKTAKEVLDRFCS